MGKIINQSATRSKLQETNLKLNFFILKRSAEIIRLIT